MCRDHGHTGEACSPVRWVRKGCPEGLKNGREGREPHQTTNSKSKNSEDPTDDGSEAEEGSSRGEAEAAVRKGRRAPKSWAGRLDLAQREMGSHGG